MGDEALSAGSASARTEPTMSADSVVRQDLHAGRDAFAAVNQTINIHYEESRGEDSTQSPAKLRVYVSSTYQDLRECRAQVRVALQRLGVDDVSMETYVAEETRPVDRCLEDVRSCDVYVGVFAWRYGYIPDGSGKSITELEYDAAGEAGIPRLIFLHDEQAPWPLVSVDRAAAFERIEALRARLSSRHVCDFFSNADDLRSKVGEAVAREIQRRAPAASAAASAAPGAAGFADWTAYKRRLIEEYRRLDLDALTPPEREEYLQIGLREVFVEPNVREDVSPPELPKELLAKLQAIAELLPADIPRGMDRHSLERTRQSYRSRPAEAAFDVIGQPGNGLVVLLGDPGSGKSTLARYVALTLADDRADDRLAALRGYQPVLVELRDYALSRQRYETFGEYLTFRARSDGLGISGDLLDRHLRSGGRTLLILDGLDELFDPRERESVSRQIAGFAIAYPGTRILVTSRVVGYRQRILRDAGFRHYTIQDLDPKQIDGFLTAWYRLALHDRPTVATGRRERLAKAIRESSSIRELAGNPLLLTILAIIGKHQELPRERWKVYDHAASVLVQHWDVNKHLQDARVDAAAIREDDKKELLRRLAYRMQTGQQGLAGNHIWHDELAAEIEDYLKARFQYEPPQAAVIADAMIDQFRERNFVLARYGSKIYGFVHRALLEFFCASEIVARFEKTRALSEEELVTRVFGDHWEDLAWTEVLRLIAGMVDASIADRLITHLVTGARPRRSAVLDQPPLDAVALAVQCLVEVRNHTAAAECAGHTLRALIETLRRPIRSFAEDRDQRLEQTILPAAAAIGARWLGREAFLDWFHDYGGRTAVRPAALFAARFAAALFPDSESLRADLERRALTSVVEEQRRAAALGLAKVWPESEDTRDVLLEVAKDPIIVVRHAAIEALSEQWPADAKVLAALHDAALDYDNGVRKAALVALSTNWSADPETLPAIRRALLDTDEEVREAALRALVGRWADHPDTLPTVHRMVRRDPHWDVRRAALEVLVNGWPDDPETLALVLRAAREVDEDVRQRAIESLAARWADHPETLPIVQRGVRDVDDGVRQSAVELLASRWADHPDTIGQLEETSRDHVAAVRYSALRALATIAGASVDGVLRQAVQDVDPAARSLAVDWLVASRDEHPDGFATLCRAALDPDAGVRRKAVTALCEHWPHDPQSRAVALNAVRDPYADNRKGAFQALAKCWGDQPEFSDVLQSALSDLDWSVRQVALETVSSLHASHAEVRRALLHATLDSSGTIRGTALAALIADPHWSENRAEVLELATRDANDAVRITAHDVVYADRLETSSRDDLLQAAQSDVSYLREYALFELVARHPADPAVWEAVEQAARDSNSDVRRMVFDLVALRRADTVTGRRLLLDATRDPSQTIRLIAIRLVMNRWPDELGGIGLPGRALSDSYGATRRLATQTLILRQSQDSPIHDDLVRACGDSSWDVRIFALWELAEHRCDDAGPSPLFARLAHSPTASCRKDALAASTMRWPDSSDTLPLIHSALEDPEADVRKHALMLALGRWPRNPELIERVCWDISFDVAVYAHRALAARGDRPDPANAAEAAVLVRDCNAPIRATALEALLIRWPDAPETHAAVRLALRDESPEIQNIARDAVCLRWACDGDVFEAVRTGLQQPAPHSRYTALRILVNAGADLPDKRDLLYSVLGDEYSYIQLAALEILVATWPGEEEIRQFAMRLSRDRNDEIRLAAMKQVVERWLADGDTKRAMVFAASDPAEAVRRFALETLAMHWPADALTAAAFARACSEPARAIRALTWDSTILPRRRVRDLEQLRQDAEAAEWFERRDAIHELVERWPDHGELPELLRHSLSDPVPEIRWNAVDALVTLWPTHPMTYPAVLNAATDRSPIVRWNVARALADGWAEEDAAFDTVLRLSTDIVAFVRVIAIGSMVRRWSDRVDSNPEILLQAVHDSNWWVRWKALECALPRVSMAPFSDELRRSGADTTPATRGTVRALLDRAVSALPNDVSSLLAVYRGDDKDLASLAAYLLAARWSDQEAVLPVLREAAGRTSADQGSLRIRALLSLLSNWGEDDETLPALLAAVDAEGAGVREVALDALCLPRYADSALPIIRGSLNDEDALVRMSVRDSLVARGFDHALIPNLVEAVAQGVEPAMDRQVSAKILYLQDLDVPEVRDVIERATHDEELPEQFIAWLKWLHEGVAEEVDGS